MGGASSAVAASSHAACARFRGTDPLITKRTRRHLARELGHPDTSGRIPEARWMRAMVFERLVRDERFASRVATTTVGRLDLPRPDSVIVADAKLDRGATIDLLGKGLAVATAANKATLIHAPAAAYPGFENAGATDVLPDFVVVAPRTDAPDRAWLVVGDAKDYERVRSRIDDARLLKGYLQVAFGAEAFDQWSERPDGLDIHQFGVLAVPKNAFLQPMAIVEDLRDHRDEVRTRLAERWEEAAGAEWTPSVVPADLVPHLLATFDPGSCVSCSLFTYCRSELRASTDPQSLLVELGVPADARQHVIGLVDGRGEASPAAQSSIEALVTATVRQTRVLTGQYRVDPVGEAATVNVVLAKSDSAALGVHGLGVQLVTEEGRGDWQFHVFDTPQAPETRLAVVGVIGEAVQAAILEASGRNPDRPDPVHIVVPDRTTADVLASIADALAGVELSRLRWERDLEEGRPALTFDGEPAEIPSALTDVERMGVSFLLEEDRARALTLRIPTVDVRSVLARHVVSGGPAVNAYRLDYLVEWAAATDPLDHRTVGDAIEQSAHTPGARLSNVQSDAIHAALTGRSGGRGSGATADPVEYERLVLEELRYKASTLERAIDVLDAFPVSRLRGVHRAIEGDAQAVWQRRLALHASDLVRFGRTYRWWRDQLVETIEADGMCHDQLLALTNPHSADEAATDAGTRHIACARVASLAPLTLDVQSRSIVDGSRIVLLHVNGEPCVESQTTEVAHQGGSFRIDGLSIGSLARGDVPDDEPRTFLEWMPGVMPGVAVGDELVVADYDWYHSYANCRYLAVDRPSPDDTAAPKPDCQPGDYEANPTGHAFCCKPHEANEAEWSDELARRRAAGTLNPETWPPVQDEDGFDVAPPGDPVGDPDAEPAVAAPDDLTLDDLE
jgi:hypothetical protein